MAVDLLANTDRIQKNLSNKSYQGIAVTETLINGFFTVDKKWTVTYWNKAAEKLLGVKAADILGKNIWERFASVIPLNFYIVYQKAFLQDIPVHFQEYWAEMGAWFDVITYHNDNTLSVSFKSSSQPMPVHPQQQLRILNELYKYITEVTNDCLCEWDLLTKEIFWIDGGHKRAFGYNIENALVPQSFWESRIHPDDLQRVRSGLQKKLNEGLAIDWQTEYRFKKADGEYAYVCDRGHIIYDKQKTPCRMIGATQDISSRKKTELKLLEERLTQQREITEAVLAAQETERTHIGQELHDNLNQVLVVANWNIRMAKTDKAQSEMYLDKSIAHISDVIEQIRKLSRSLIIPDAQFTSLSDNIRKIADDLMAVKPLKIVYHKVGIDNSGSLDHTMQLNIFRIVQEQLNNIVKHADATHVAITLKKQSASVSLSISDNGKGCDLSKEKNGVGIININSRVDLYGGTVNIISKPGGGFKLNVLMPLKRPDLLNQNLLYNSILKSNLLRASAPVRSPEALQPATDSDDIPLIVPPLLKLPTGQFAYALAHEVRNPLSNINLSVELMKSTTLDDEQRMYLDIIIRGTGNINDVVIDLLTYFKADETEAEKYSIQQLLDEIVAMTADRIMMKNIRIVRHYAKQDHNIFINKQQMRIAITNIIINAIDAMSGENSVLTLTTKIVNHKQIIEIADNGIGIGEEKLKTIFEPYVSNKPGGMGLGLSTTLDILNAHHASVEVKSELGKGTRFILSFQNLQ